MSSGMGTELTPAEELGLELALLCDALDMLEHGAFLFTVCEEGLLRERLIQHVREHLEIQGRRRLIKVELAPDQPDLAGQLARLYELSAREESFIPSAAPRRGSGGAPATATLIRDRSPSPVVFVHTRGLAEPRDENAIRALRALNFQRERLSRLNVPLVFWISQNELGQVMQHAADVFAARSGLFYFEAPVREPSAPSALRAEALVDLLDRFHRTLLPPDELRRRAALYEKRLKREQAAGEPHWPRMAYLCRDLANLYRELDDYERAAEFQDKAIVAFQKAIAEREQEEEWAALQVWLGRAYFERIRGERAENIERAIQHYQQALKVYTRPAFPEQWAATQNNLATAYAERIRGDRAENLERAIQHYQQALEVRTREVFPEEWAATQNNLAIAYSDRIRGDRAENLERAIQHYQQALEVRTRPAFPEQWAATQNNLAAAYADRICGDRAENLERAIQHYQQALEVYTRPAFPEQWAATQNNLATAYLNRIRGERAENIEQAIQHFRQALEVRTREAFPEQWATTQHNLAIAYRNRIRGERAENLERAVHHYRQALQVQTLEVSPRDVTPSGGDIMHERDTTFVLMLEAAMPLIRENLTDEEWAAFSAGLRALAPLATGPDADPSTALGASLEALVDRIRDVARPYAYVRGILGQRGAPMIPSVPARQTAPVAISDVAQRLYGLLKDPEGVAQRQAPEAQPSESQETGAGHAPQQRDA